MFLEKQIGWLDVQYPLHQQRRRGGSPSRRAAFYTIFTSLHELADPAKTYRRYTSTGATRPYRVGPCLLILILCSLLLLLSLGLWKEGVNERLGFVFHSTSEAPATSNHNTSMFQTGCVVCRKTDWMARRTPFTSSVDEGARLARELQVLLSSPPYTNSSIQPSGITWRVSRFRFAVVSHASALQHQQQHLRHRHAPPPLSICICRVTPHRSRLSGFSTRSAAARRTSRAAPSASFRRTRRS